ncbi:MAG: hypothetical protein NZ518_12275, partial [Dehalococcoidia bacterium]|nr:hypothetical protein [Dehalococcoidia bacterium]
MRLVSILLVLGALMVSAVDVTAQAPRNMIVNANFSQGFDPFRGGEVGKGWTAFVLSGSPSFRDTAALSPDFVERIDGPTSQTIWSDGPGFVAGIYQTRGVTPGRQYKAWLTTSAKARGDATIARTIGVDPTGGTDPTSRSIQWGTTYTGERWATIELGNAPMVVFTATGPRATVFVKVTVTGSG